MSEFIESVPSMGTGEAAGTLPKNAGELIRSDEWGIDNLLENYIIQNESVTESRLTDQTADQKGAVVSELDYDCRWDLNLTLIGDATKAPVTGDSTGFAVGDITFNYMSHNWKLASCTYSGTYNGKKTYQITAYRFKNFPAQPVLP